MAVKVPTNAFGDIRFGTINVASLVTTNIDCTEGGVWLTLYKDNATAPEMRSEVRIAYTEADEAPVSWALLNLTCRSSAAGPFAADLCSWLEPEAQYGNLTDHVALLARASGLPERMEVDSFVARLALSLVYDGGHTRDVIVDVHAAVYAAAVAARSVLGSVPAEGRCDNVSHAHAAATTSTATVAIGSVHVLPVSLCDFEGLAVDHQLPRGTLAEVEDVREVSARYRRVANASSWLAAERSRRRGSDADVERGGESIHNGEPWQAAGITYDGGARYAVRVAPPALGHYEVEAYLGDAPVGRPLLLLAVCPAGLVPSPGGSGCGCDAGHEPDFAAAAVATAAAAAAAAGTSTGDGVMDAEAQPCAPCAEGTAKATIGDHSCAACVPGHHQPLSGQAACLPCAPSTFTAAAGATTCGQCEAGSSSPAAAAACDECTAGMYAMVGMAPCAPCAAGTYSWREASAACAPCERGKHALGGASACISCGLQDSLQRTASLDDPDAPRGVNCSGGELLATPASHTCHPCLPTLATLSALVCLRYTPGLLRGVVPGYWAAHDLTAPRTLASQTRVWPCEPAPALHRAGGGSTTPGAACLGGLDSACREGHEGLLCASGRVEKGPAGSGID
jgi:hypothetical protein